MSENLDANTLKQLSKMKNVDEIDAALAQDGSIKNDGTILFSPEQILRMDWLCENVIGRIPVLGEILPECYKVMQEIGIYRDTFSIAE